MLRHKIYSFLSRFRQREIEYPFKDLKNVAIRPPLESGETLYSLPLIQKLSEKYNLWILFPEDKEIDIPESFSVNRINYPSEINFMRARKMKSKLNMDIDLFIELNRKNAMDFCYMLNFPLCASIYDQEGLNLLIPTDKKPIDDIYNYMAGMLGISLDWDNNIIGLKKWKKGKRPGIHSEIDVELDLVRVKSVDDLYRISFLISEKNELSSMAFFLGIPQVLFLPEEDNFTPPESIKIIRFKKSISREMVKRALDKYSDSTEINR